MILSGILNRIRRVGHIFIPPSMSLQQKRVIPWFKANGDKTLRLDYNLNSDSLVFDLGGYEGQWASDIYSKYRCRIFIFEPYLPYVKKIRQRFELNDDLTVFDIGLSSESKEVVLGISDDASSIYKTSATTSVIKLEEALSFFEDHQIHRVDLMKVNIEGGEFDLIDHLIETGLVSRIRNIQVQFHDFVPNAHGWREKLQEKLGLTHKLTYNYEFVWENWEIKEVIN